MNVDVMTEACGERLACDHARTTQQIVFPTSIAFIPKHRVDLARVLVEEATRAYGYEVTP